MTAGGKAGRLFKAARSRAPWVLGGALALLAVSELGLRLAGYAWRERGPVPAEGKHVILCEGDSFVFGIGGTAFPRQLQLILDEKHPGKFQVINHGVPGSNTAQIYERLGRDLPRLRPNTVIVIAGQPLWNLEGRDLTGFPWWTRADKALLTLKTYKLAKLFLVGWREGGFLADTSGRTGAAQERLVRYPGREKDFLEVTHLYPYDWQTVEASAGRIGPELSRGKTDAAVDRALETLQAAYVLDTRDTIMTRQLDEFPALRAALEAGRKLHPDSEKTLFAMGEYHFRRAELDEAEACFGKAARLYPRSARVHAGLAMCLLDRYDQDGAYKLIQKALALSPNAFKVRMALARYYANQAKYSRAADELLKLPAEIRPMFIGTILNYYARAQMWKKIGDLAATLPESQALSPAGYKALGQYWAGRGDDARGLKILEEGLRRYPDDFFFYRHMLSHLNYPYEKMVGLIVGFGGKYPQISGTEPYRAVVALHEKSRESGKDLFSLLSQSIRKDMWRIWQLSRQYDARLILSSYPHLRYPEIEDVAAQFRIPYIDFHSRFAERFPEKDDYLSSDGCHCNTAGYRFMAETFAQELLEPWSRSASSASLAASSGPREFRGLPPPKRRR